MTRLYLDVCAIQRPFDDRSQLRVHLEAEAVSTIVKACRAGLIELVASSVHQFETEKNPFPDRREYAESVLSLAPTVRLLSESAITRAAGYGSVGIVGPDSLHLAVAVEARADYFCTTDDALQRRSTLVDTMNVSVVSPIELSTALDLL